MPPNKTIKTVKYCNLDEFGLDVFVKHELGEDEELLGEELVREVDGCVHHASAVRANRVGDVADVDRVEVLVVARALHKDLQQSLHLFNSLFSRTTWVSRYQKGKTSLDLNKARRF